MKFAKSIFKIFIFLTLVFILAEIGLRLLGYKPKERFHLKEKFLPHLAHCPDSYLGYKNVPGEYKIIINDLLIWNATNLTDGSRSCGIHSDTVSVPKKKVFVYGCSSIYGVGLNDNQTYPYKLQSKNPDLIVRNFSVGGYNILYSYLWLLMQLKESQKPDLVLMNWGSYYLERMVFSRQWREGQYSGLKHSAYIDSIYFPVGSVSNNKLKINRTKLAYFENPLTYYSAFFSLFNNLLNNIDINASNAEVVNEKVINQIIQLSKEHKFRLIFTVITDDELSHTMMKKFANEKIEFVDISLKNENHKYDLYPLDGHPNSLANDTITERVTTYLKIIK